MLSGLIARYNFDMFGQSNWKKEVESSIRELREELADVKRQNNDLRASCSKLSRSFKTVTRKLVLRLPLSLESLQKDLNYDLIFPEELEAWLQMAKEGVMIDLRSQSDFENGSLPGAVNIPHDQLAKMSDRFPQHQAFLLICENGVKSVSASETLEQKGFPFVYVLKGGMNYYQGRTIKTEFEGDLADDSPRSGEASV